MVKSALIVIDAQRYFIKKNIAWLPRKIAVHIKNNNYDFVLFTKFVNNAKSNFARTFNWRKCSNTPDTDICPELLDYVNKDNVFEKSAFSAFKSLALKKFLEKHSIKKVFLCGTDTDACVLSSAFEAFDLGYNVKVIKELCASSNGNMLHDYANGIIRRNLETAPRI